MKKANVHFMSKSNEWETLQFLFDGLCAEFGFELDVCATPENAKCKRFFTKADNTLPQNCAPAVCWMNSPYARQISGFMQKALEESQLGATVVALVPARTDTHWLHKDVNRGEVRFLKGRLRLVGAKHCDPFPSAIVVFQPPRCG